MTHIPVHLYDDDDAEEPVRHRKPRAKIKIPIPADAEMTDDITTMTYKPALYEDKWLRSSLREFYLQHYLSDVMSQVRGGKEANVYRCAPYRGLRDGWIAAKVYRPRMFRNLRNDKMYREGRAVLSLDGKGIKDNEERVMRALHKKSDFGVQVELTSWLMYEFTTLQQLHAAGALVPEPIAVGSNTILMEYIGDEHQAAPTLHDTTIPTHKAADIFTQITRSIEIMLQSGFVHGDLSAYNILYHHETEKIAIIDFPQVVNTTGNPLARAIFERDIARVCDYFTDYDIDPDPHQLAEELWQKYLITEEILLVEENALEDFALVATEETVIY